MKPLDSENAQDSMELEILYEDNHLLVVNKPAGLLTQPSGTDHMNLEELCKSWIKEKYHKPGAVFLEAIHRLDKPVSGIVVFAKTSKSLSRLQAFVRSKTMQKIYYAIVEGFVKQKEKTLEHYLIHGDYKAHLSTQEKERSKKSRLHYQLVKSLQELSLLEISLETGRYHQIRAQLSAIGHPILGDTKYGSHVNLPSDVIALHHYKLQIPHPTKEIIMKFQAPLPTFWSQWME